MCSSDENECEGSRRYKAFLKASPDIMAFIRRDGTYIDLHPGCEIAPLVDLDSLRGKKVGDILPSLQAEWMEAIETALVENRTVNLQFTLPGRVSLYEARVIPSGPDEVLMICRDMTVLLEIQKRLETKVDERTIELERSNKSLEQFAYAASHDLREPALKIQGFGRRLKEMVGDKAGEKGAQYLDIMLSASARMVALIDDLLAYSRVGRKDGNLEYVDLGRIAQEALLDFGTTPEDLGAKITVGPMPQANVDPVQFRILFHNLLSNAIKFRHPGRTPEVTVEAREEKGMVVVEVQDNGIGFDPVFSERIFLIFERLHTRFDYPGTGIGLALCKRVVERHGGWIAAEGRPGEGATFRFAIPQHGGSA